jgi:hypothetical protein
LRYKTFVRRLTNFLLLKTNYTACIHTHLWMSMAGSKAVKTMNNYKKAVIRDQIVKVTDPKFVLGVRSKQYQLHPRVKEAMGEAGWPVSEGADP